MKKIIGLTYLINSFLKGGFSALFRDRSLCRPRIVRTRPKPSLLVSLRLIFLVVRVYDFVIFTVNPLKNQRLRVRAIPSDRRRGQARQRPQAILFRIGKGFNTAYTAVYRLESDSFCSRSAQYVQYVCSHVREKSSENTSFQVLRILRGKKAPLNNIIILE